jgi:hypothetical protein
MPSRRRTIDRPAVDRSDTDDPDATLGYVFAIRSERLLCREVLVNLAYRWFCGLSIEDKVPDHSAFSRARNERFRDSDIFRHVFRCVVGATIWGDQPPPKRYPCTRNS